MPGSCPTPEAVRPMVRVLLLDNDASTRAVLRLRLSLEPDLKVVGDAADRDTVLALAEELVPDVVVMDVKDPGLDGTAAAGRRQTRGGRATAGRHPLGGQPGLMNGHLRRTAEMALRRSAWLRSTLRPMPH